MAADKDYMDYIMDLLAPLGEISGKAMFGGYGVFQEGSMFALISGSALYFKVDDSNRTAYEDVGSMQFKPMPYYEVPAEVMENTVKLNDWANVSIAIAHASAARKKR